MVESWLNHLLYTLLPGKCILCSAQSRRQLDLCLDCQKNLPVILNPCWQCGLCIPKTQEICGTCLVSAPSFVHCFAAFEYAAPMNKLIAQFKNQHNLVIGHVLSQVLANSYLSQHLILPDLWLPMPLHEQKLKQRGFNQAVEIADVLAKVTGRPLANNLCRRIKLTKDQKSLSLSQRRTNVKHAFELAQSPAGKSIAIVDDVVTTSATVGELSKLLLDSGATEIQVVCLARTSQALQA